MGAEKDRRHLREEEERGRGRGWEGWEERGRGRGWEGWEERGRGRGWEGWECEVKNGGSQYLGDRKSLGEEDERGRGRGRECKGAGSTDGWEPNNQCAYPPDSWSLLLWKEKNVTHLYGDELSMPGLGERMHVVMRSLTETSVRQR
jgi:hypothetical protein